MKFFGKSTFQLIDGNAVSGFTLRADQIRYSFSLCQVELSIDEGTASEFSGFGHAATMSNQYLQEFLLNEYRAVYTDLGRIFASERVGGFEEGNQHFVKHLAMVFDVSIIGFVRDHFSNVEGLAVLHKQLTYNWKRCRS